MIVPKNVQSNIHSIYQEYLEYFMYLLHYDIYICIHINCPVGIVKISNVLTLNISYHFSVPRGGISPIRTILVFSIHPGKATDGKLHHCAKRIFFQGGYTINKQQINLLYKIIAAEL
jgi:hypothetical protein